MTHTMAGTVRMLIKAGYRNVYISRNFAQANGFIPQDAAPGQWRSLLGACLSPLLTLSLTLVHVVLAFRMVRLHRTRQPRLLAHSVSSVHSCLAISPTFVRADASRHHPLLPTPALAARQPSTS